MLQLIIDYALIIAFIALTLDIIIQIIHIWKRRSSKDISLKGCIIRFIGVLIILVKFFLLKDIYLIFGQTLLMLTYILYIFLIIYFRK